jgi:hypothetical protein
MFKVKRDGQSLGIAVGIIVLNYGVYKILLVFVASKRRHYKHLISTILPNIRAGIRVTIQPWSIRNLTDFRRYIDIA